MVASRYCGRDGRRVAALRGVAEARVARLFL